LKKDKEVKVKEINFTYPFSIIKAIEIEKTDKEEGKWIVEGYAGTSDLDLQGDVIIEEAFKNSEKDLLENSTVLYNHDVDRPIGKVEEVKAQKEGLWVKVLISKTAAELWQQIKEGVVNKFSIRGQIIKKVEEYITELKRIAHVIKEMYLVECSLVTLPANTKAKTLNWYVQKALIEKESLSHPGVKTKSFKTKEEVKAQMEKFILTAENLNAIKSSVDTLLERAIDEDTKSLLNSIKEKMQGEKLDVEKKYTQEEADVLIAEAKKSTDNKKYSQEEVDKLIEETKKTAIGDKLFSQEEVDKMIEDAKKSVDGKFTQEEVDVKIEDSKKSIITEKEGVEKKLSDLETKVKKMEAEANVAKKWDAMADSYKEEDAVAIKAILLKSEMGEVVTLEETTTLIEKKLGSRLRVSSPDIKSGDTSETRKAELRKLGGIRPRKT